MIKRFLILHHLNRKVFWMVKKKKIILIYYIICISIILLSLFMLRNKIMNYINNTLLYKDISVLNLTTDEKIADFEEFYINIIESVPLLDEQETLYGISFKNRKDYYLNLIKKTENDFQFFSTMSAIEEDIPSKHTDICFPLYSSFFSLDCYNSEKVLSKYNIKPLTEYWYKTIGNACKKFSKVQRVNFKYINGQYLFDPLDSGDKYQDFKRFELVSINNEPMSEYIIKNISTYNIRYDYKRNVPYRRYFTLNDSVGEKVNVTLFNSDDGSTINTELYFDIQIEIVDSFSYLYSEKEENMEDSNTEDNFFSYFDYSNNIGYVDLKNMSNSRGQELKTTIESMKDFDSIIIDLRDNYGGYTEYTMNYLYPAIYSDDITTKLNWTVPISNSNKVVNNNLQNRLFYKTDKSKDNNIIHYAREYTYKGQASSTRKNIYYLINQNTASAADGYISIIKENKLGTIIGTNTYGEGTADSFVCNSLKNSGFVYIYFPSTSYNKDKTNNSLYGTSPDIYIEQTKDSFYQERSLRANQVDINLYTEKVKYDPVLIKTIEMIQQDEN